MKERHEKRVLWDAHLTPLIPGFGEIVVGLKRHKITKIDKLGKEKQERRDRPFIELIRYGKKN